MKALVIDLNKCNGCYNCQIACKDEHCDNDWSPIAKPQPVTGQFWCRVNQKERGRVPVVRVLYTPTFCDHCDDCPLLSLAPDCVYRNELGFVIIDPEKAKGRRELVDACPKHMVFWNADLQIAQKCTGCTHLLENGWTEPRCVESCSTGALRFGEPEEFGDELVGASHQAGSHLYYLNVPGRWIAGTVADREINEVLIGARVTVSDVDGHLVATGATDEFGDFRFYDLAAARYQVHIEADGIDPVDLVADCTEEDVVFDDIFVHFAGVRTED